MTDKTYEVINALCNNRENPIARRIGMELAKIRYMMRDTDALECLDSFETIAEVLTEKTDDLEQEKNL